MNEKVLYAFGSGTDGASPAAGLIDMSGTLYGTTESGGAYGGGTVFSIDRKTGAESVLHSFGSGADGQFPEASVIEVNGMLYGTTQSGGSYGYGTVYSLDASTGTETVVYSFCPGGYPCIDGASSYASLIEVKGILYGTTYEGGAYGAGTVFSLDPKNDAETVLYSFCTHDECLEGEGGPYAGLIYVNGTLYGTTYADGSSGGGEVFSLDLSTGAETVLHSFGTGGDGDGPRAGLIDVNGMLYGTTAFGGAHGGGTVFALGLMTGKGKVLYSFCSKHRCTDGLEPLTSLINVNGTLYGTSAGGGANCLEEFGCGTVFAVDPTTGAETVIYSFCSQENCTDGLGPVAGLIDLAGALVNGTLYGTTIYGGANCTENDVYPGCGTVFALRAP